MLRTLKGPPPIPHPRTAIRAAADRFRRATPTLRECRFRGCAPSPLRRSCPLAGSWKAGARSEEHTSELQSHSDLVCRLLLEKKKTESRMDRRLTYTLSP